MISNIRKSTGMPMLYNSYYRYADIGISAIMPASMPFCRSDMPISAIRQVCRYAVPICRYIGISAESVKKLLPICRYADIGNSASMPLCRADMPISAIRQVCRYAVPICRYADIDNSASMPLCRTHMPIYRYIGRIGEKVTADIPICRYRQFGKYAVMPCRYTDIWA